MKKKINFFQSMLDECPKLNNCSNGTFSSTADCSHADTLICFREL